MKRNGVLILPALIALTAGAAHAAGAVAIAAGEHGGYSRIVIPGGANAAIRHDGRNIDVRLAGDGQLFDLAEINERHKAHRVERASRISDADGEFIRLQLNCECKATSRLLADGRLIIDITPPPATEPTNPTPQKTVSAAPPPRSASQPAAPAAAPADGAPTNLSPAAQVNDLSVDEARERMRELLQLAAEEGFVTMRGSKRVPAKLASSESASDDPSERVIHEAPRAAEGESEKPARVATYSCLPDADLAINPEGVEKDPLGVIVALREEFENAYPEDRGPVMDEFVRAYLAIGFGEEALALLSDHDASQTLLADMARVIADSSLAENGPLLGPEGCAGAHALWQAAAGEPQDAVVAWRRSGQTIHSYPDRLRTLLATRIAKKLIDAGDWSSVKALYRIAEPGAAYAPADVQYIAARLLDHDGRSQEAEEILLDVAAGDSEVSKNALLALAEHYAAGDDAHEGFVDDIGALAKIERGSEAGEKAAVHEAIVWADAGNIEAGVFLLRNSAESGGANVAEASREARLMLTKSFASEEGAQRFAALRSFLENRTFVESQGFDAALRSAAADTALEIGLPNLAVQLAEPLKANESREAALLKARAALAAGLPEQALAIAAPYADEADFASLVVNANLDLDRGYAALAAASALPEGPGKAQRMAIAAWLAGDWASAMRAYQRIDPNIMGEADAFRFALSAYMAGAQDLPPAAEAVLRREESASLDGVKSLFESAPAGAVLDRGKALVESVDEEIHLIREALSHG